MDTSSLDITRALKVSIQGLPKDWRRPPGRPCHIWKQISSLLTLASTQHGNTLRIENTGSTSWKLLCSISELARDDDDDSLLSMALQENHIFLNYRVGQIK